MEKKRLFEDSNIWSTRLGVARLQLALGVYFNLRAIVGDRLADFISFSSTAIGVNDAMFFGTFITIIGSLVGANCVFEVIRRMFHRSLRL